MEYNALSSGIIQVKLIKKSQYGLGFQLRSRTNSSCVVISDLVKGGSAAESGLVQDGDILVKVNDISILDKSCEEAVSILQFIPVNSQVVLLLRCQDGYTAHLETRFGEDGIPRTVRITKPINQPETFMSRIKRTLCSSNKVSEATELNALEVKAGYVEKDKEILSNRRKRENNDADKNKTSEIGEGLYSDLSEDRGGSYSSVNTPKKAVKLINTANERPAYRDTLHMKALGQFRSMDNIDHMAALKTIESTGCTSERCLGSLMLTPSNLPPGTSRSKPELIHQAKEFIDEYYASMKRQNKTAHQKRWMDVLTSIENTGTYELTINELTFGAKTAWRNAPRCIGRIQWSKLQIFDARHITTARGMFEAICNHIKYGMNNGNIRSAITIFAPRTSGRHDFRVWNSQLLSYAGYKQPDRSVIGDPINAEFTELCQKLGWKGKGGRFDILPLVLQANEHDPELFEIPSDLVLEVNLKHPKFSWFADLGLKWYSLPAVSNMLFDCGGLEFTASPFNGWYMGTEIGARDLCDPHRYNMLETIAQKMELDTRKNSSLWKDQALVEVNVAVLYSYQEMGVTIMDHHAAAESFMKHVENEQRLRGGCPADWVWIVPPMSGSLLPVFRQEMLLYKLKPSYEYQEVPWKTHVWKKDKDKTKNADKPRRKIGFRQLVKAVEFSVKLMGRALARRVKCTILYATETGKSEEFARTLCQIFKHAFHAKVLSMDDYDSTDLEHEVLLLIVTSTFGNGDPPENGEVFAKTLFEIKHSDSQHESCFGQINSFQVLSRIVSVRYDYLRCFAYCIYPVTPGMKKLGEAMYLEEYYTIASSVTRISLFSILHPVNIWLYLGNMNLGEMMHLVEYYNIITKQVTVNHSSCFDDLGLIDKGKQTSYKSMRTSSFKDEDHSLDPSNKEGKKRGDNFPSNTGPLGNVRYSVFGLGSRAYPNFCAFGHNLDTILHALGAERILKMGEGDELCAQKESFKFWARDIFKAACEAFCVGDENTILDAVGFFSETDLTWSPEKFRLTPSEEMPPDICEGLSKLHGKTVVPSRLIESKQLQSLESSRQTLLVRLDTQGASELLYSPGDHLAVFAENSLALVDGILACLHNAPPVDQAIKIEMQSQRTTPLGNMKAWEKFPKFPICTLRTALCRYLDITTPPTQSFLKILATQASKTHDKEALENLANDLQAYEDWKHEKVPNLLEVLQEFPSIKIPAALILTQLPILQQRYYSISSSPAVYPGEIHATVAVVKNRTQGNTGSFHEGVCSSWLNRIASGTIVPCLVRIAPSFNLPRDNTLPVIMVGPGTGIAPFRSFWQHRKIDREMLPVPHKQDKSQSGWGKMYLYFGCRSSQVDDIYRVELQTAKEEGVLTNVYTAFSREPNKSKMYVQDYLLQNSSDIYNSIIREGGHFYICGDAKMATDVMSTLEKILQKEGNMPEQDAKNFILKLRDCNQFHEDIFWSNFKELRSNRQGQVPNEKSLEVDQSQRKTEQVPVITEGGGHNTKHG